VECAEINGRTFLITHVLSRNRNAWARLKEDTIVISLPSRWPKAERERIAARLEKRAIRAIERGKWGPAHAAKLKFFHGQRFSAMGKELEIAFVPSKRFWGRVKGNRIEVKVDDSHPEKETIASKLAGKRIVENLMPELLARIREINDAHFGAAITKVGVRENSTRWGSCSKSGSISLNLRLLFMPQNILEYVIVHELAHTKYRSHGPRFWALVEKVMPDHKERRKWLRENGWKVPESISGTRETGNGKQQRLGDFE
jgi:predicted metal-dependent hydrolase